MWGNTRSDKTYLELIKMTECNAIIEANNEIDRLKRENKKLNALCVQYGFDMGKLEEENELLKQTIKGVYEILSIDVDVFSDKATEHDINAYIELKELDNKDAYCIAKGTKKAIELLKKVIMND